MARQNIWQRAIIDSGYGLLTLVVAFWLAWLLLAQVNFLYGVWHDVGGIKEGIEKFGPQNRYKVGFADTSRDQRLELFASINKAIHNGGQGLADIVYTTAEEPRAQTLLREPEVVHLQDVANLIDLLVIVVAVVLFFWLLLGGWYLIRYGCLPKLLSQIKGIGLFIMLTAALVLVIGAESVFNQLHIWVFPADHEWFFYYQDSLMSTMMFAPNLFAYIALAIVVLSLPLFVLLQLGFNKAGQAILSVNRSQ